VLARGQGALDVCRLRGDGQRDDDGLNVVAREEVVERLGGAGVFGVEVGGV